MVNLLVSGAAYELYDVKATRTIEQTAQRLLPTHALMQRAGLAAAQLALAIAPHAQRIWLACGPGNNGGDGLETATQLKLMGKTPVVTWLGNLEQCLGDTKASFARAKAADVCFADSPDSGFDLLVDALLGIGAQLREPVGRMADCIDRLNQYLAPTLAIDIPSGLSADTGCASTRHVRANHTLSLLTLKPGLFTAQGRDVSGQVWLDTLEVCQSGPDLVTATAHLLGAPGKFSRLHDSHKGSYGDVAVLGGAPGMTGAALLAATSALRSGAGRVFVALLDDCRPIQVDPFRPELMFRQIMDLDYSSMTVVCGCGGGSAIGRNLPRLLDTATRLVLDADALNAISTAPQLAEQLVAGAQRDTQIVLTPHPLEAARLLGCASHDVQRDRIGAARQLSTRFGCTVVLKGSGTIVAGPQHSPMINPTGNARLATAGTGDVLAGMIGANLAAGMPAFESACWAVYLHGQLADEYTDKSTLIAGTMASL